MKRIKRLTAFLLLFLSLPLNRASAAPIRKKKDESKKIALSFDDGPSRTNCETILEILKKYNVRATFFIIGECAAADEEKIALIGQAGHELGNHTYTHADITRLSEEELEKEVKKTEEILTRISGTRPVVFRPPGGAYNEASLRVLEKMGYQTVLWSVDTRDWTKPKVSTIVNTVEKNTAGGDIILFHDLAETGSTTPEALEIVIPFLLEEGYEFVTVSELLNEKGS